MRFARIGEEVFLRFSEISCEEFRLYAIIVFHTFTDTQLCRMTLRELADLYNLDYDNLTRRFKTLRMKSWVEKTRKGIRPLVGMKTVKITVSDDEKTVNSTVQNCKNYSSQDEKTVNSTVSLIPFKEPLKQEPLNTHTEDGVRENFQNGHRSVFSLEECIRYAEICKSNGDDIISPKALGKSIYKSGEFDVFIRATLYPENQQTAGDDNRLADGLKILLEMDAEGFDLDEWKKWYSEEEWEWLMKEMEKARAAQN